MNKKIMRITLSLCTIACGVWNIWWGNLIVEKYEANMAEIDALQSSVEIADKYMYDEYNSYWMDLDDVMIAGMNEEFSSAYFYEISAVQRVGKDKYKVYYVIEENSQNGIYCKTVTGYPGTHIISRWYDWQNTIPIIDCSVDVYVENKGWIDEYFEIFYEDGQYYMCRDDGETVRRYSETEVAEIEGKTGLTLEEMVDIAYDAQEKLEKLICDVKEQAKVVEKERMIQRLVILSIPPLCLIGMGIVYEIMLRKSRTQKKNVL